MEEAVIQRLLADAAVSAIAGDRIFPGRIPQGESRPVVVLQTINAMPYYADEGEVRYDESRVQLDCWAASYGQAKQLSRAVIASLSPVDLAPGAPVFTGTGIEFQFIELNGARDLPESGSNAAEYFFRVSLDFTFWTSPAP